MFSNNMEIIVDKITELINKNIEYIDLYSCLFYDKKIIFKIKKYNDIEFLFYEFKKRVYYCLRNMSIIKSLVNINEKNDFQKVNIVNESKKITLYYNNDILVEIFFEIF